MERVQEQRAIVRDGSCLGKGEVSMGERRGVDKSEGELIFGLWGTKGRRIVLGRNRCLIIELEGKKRRREGR